MFFKSSQMWYSLRISMRELAVSHHYTAMSQSVWIWICSGRLAINSKSTWGWCQVSLVILQDGFGINSRQFRSALNWM